MSSKVESVVWLKENDDEVDIKFPFSLSNSIISIDGAESIDDVATKILMIEPDLEQLSNMGIYLFAYKEVILNPDDVFKSLRSQVTNKIQGSTLTEFMRNLKDPPHLMIDADNLYDIESIVQLGIDGKTVMQIAIPLGVSLDLKYTVNPLSVEDSNEVSGEASVRTGKKYLLEYGPFVDNKLYLVDAFTIFKYARVKSLDEDNLIDKYLPGLADLGIRTEGEMIKAENKLYEAFLLNKADIERYTQRDGITSIVFTDARKFIIKKGIMSMVLKAKVSPYGFPVESIFKTLNSSRKFPYIKFDPGRRRDKIYRLFAPNSTTDGRKVPMMSKGKIFALSRLVTTPRSLVIYKVVKDCECSVTLFSSGDVQVDYAGQQPVETSRMLALINLITTNVFSVIEKLSVMRMIKLVPITSFTDPRIINTNTHFAAVTKAIGRIRVIPGNKCISSMIALRQPKAGSIAGRYKQIADYNKMEAIDELIIDMMNANKRKEEVIDAVSSEFGLSKKEAASSLAQFLELMNTDYYDVSKQRLSRLGNPGIPVAYKENRADGTITVNVQNIPNIQYLDPIEKNVISTGFLLQQPKLAPNIESQIKKFCLKDDSSQETQPMEKEKTVLPPPTAFVPIQSLAVESSDSDGDDFFMSEDESTDDDSDDEGQTGGTIDAARDLTGVNLSNPNPFSKRLQTRQPRLFISKPKDGFQSYSRSCPSNTRRQPVILTDEEKRRIDKEHPGSYDKSIYYKPYDDSEGYHYICPRYWSLSHDTSLTQEDVESGKYGKLIPVGSKKVGRGEGIYQFDSKYHRGSNGEYDGVNPGFMKPSKHPDGKCVPCCFKNWNAPAQSELRKQCLGEKPQSAKALEMDEYVKGSEKVKLEPGRIGHLPLSLQTMFNIDSSSYQSPANQNMLKTNTPAIVRFGAPVSESQSFLAAVGCGYELQIGKISLTILELKKALISNLTIDKFARLQNGSLINVFKTELKPLNPSIWENSKLYSDSDPSAQFNQKALQSIQSAFLNYIDFLEDPNVFIDYEYCWDLVSLPNANLFPTGVNLIILEIPADDITNKVNVICPTTLNTASDHDPNRPYLVLLKQRNTYQTIIGYELNRMQIRFTRLFRRGSEAYSSFTKKLISLKKLLTKYCSPLPSLPNTYFLDLPVDSQIVSGLFGSDIQYSFKDYYGINIGLGLAKGQEILYVPIQPTTSDLKLPSKSVDSYEPMSLESTMTFMKSANATSNGLPCFKAAALFIEDGMIIGILTKTDQFVPTLPTIPNNKIDLPIIKSTSSVMLNKRIRGMDSADASREIAVFKIKRESQYYAAFRDELKSLINEADNVNSKVRLKSVIVDDKMTYADKIDAISMIIQDLLNDYVTFAVLPSQDTSILGTLPVCSRIDKSNCAENAHCELSGSGCKLIIPYKNLITGGNNSSEYYTKLSDELIRYGELREFLLDERGLESLNEILYEVAPDELILLHSLLTQEFFQNLDSKRVIPYAKHQSYMLAYPRITEPYSSQVSLAEINDSETDQLDEMGPDGICKLPTMGNVAGKWKDILPQDTQEVVFVSQPSECSFHVIRTIIAVNSGEVGMIPLAQVKSRLIELYQELMPEYRKAVAQLWYIEGKIEESHELKKKKNDMVSIKEIILRPSYFLSVLDILLLSQKRRIPIILYSATKIPHNRSSIMITNLASDNNYYFVKIPGIKRSSSGNYRLLVNPAESSVLFNIEMIRGNTKSEIVESIESWSDPLQKIINSPPPKKKLVLRRKLTKE